MNSKPEPATLRFALLGVLLAVVFAYRDLATHEFLNFDDNEYVSEHPVIRKGLSWQGVLWVWTSIHHATWHPLTGLSHLLDCTLFGLWAPGHLAVNLALHVANVWLLFALLHRATGAPWPSLWVAAAFGLHPLHVESVAWVSERKDVLSTLLALASSLAYVRFARSAKRSAYGWALALFAAALLAKPMVVTLPILWLLFDVWPLGRTTWSVSGEHRRRWCNLCKEKLPFFALATTAGIITLYTQQVAGALEPLQASPLRERIATAVLAYASYLRDTVWPAGLTVFYPRHPWTWSALLLGTALLLAISVLVVGWARSAPYILVGWLWFVVGILPVSGLVQAGDQARADRFTYLPLVGIFLGVAFAARAWAGRARFRRTVVAVTAIGVLLGWTVRTTQQVAVWRNSETLFRHALAVTRHNHVAHANLGAYLLERGQLQEARHHLERSLQLRSALPLARISLGVLEAQEGNLEAAAAHYRAVLALRPQHVTANFNLALVLRAQGDRQGALQHVRNALRADPSHAKAFVLLGDLLREDGDPSSAEEAYRRALELRPDLVAAHNQLALVLEASGRIGEAIQHYRHVAELAPDDPRAHFNLAAALRDAGNEQQARSHFERALVLAVHRGDDDVVRNARAALEHTESEVLH